MQILNPDRTNLSSVDWLAVSSLNTAARTLTGSCFARLAAATDIPKPARRNPGTQPGTPSPCLSFLKSYPLLSLPFHSALIVLLLLAAVGCSRQPAAPDAHPKDAGRRALDFPTNVTEYQVQGVLREIRANGAKALIAHEEIPGYMEAMTMQLDVHNTNELAGVSLGDQITFRLLTTDTDAWIDQVKRTGLRFTLPPRAAEPDSQEDELAIGAPLPDCTLTNHLGQPFNLSSFQGRALAFTFIFTRCPLPTYCPRMSGHFAAVQAALRAAAGRTNWHLLTISFDPDFDSPAQLAAYARGYQADPAHWTFATSSADIIHKLGGGFGLTFARDGASFTHNVRTVVINPAGKIQKVFAGNEWQPGELAEEMKTAMKADY